MPYLAVTSDNGGMTLTADEKQALALGKAVPITIEGSRCVLLRADVYEQAQRTRGDTNPAEIYPAVLNAWDADGSPEDAEAYADLGRQP